MIQFCLNGAWITESDIEPSMTILIYLRTKMGRSGTKEGCASGDCGACTVMVGDFFDDAWHYKAINSCITLLVSLHGRHLVTIEGLADTAVGDHLHPVQQAMVDQHGSQCGFCTPGFVMSLAAVNAAKNNQPLSEPEVLDAVSGNLCRCTGYRPIVDAALSCHNLAPNKPKYMNAEARTDINSQAELSLGAAKSSYPHNEAELLRQLSDNPNARLIAGGTDLLLEQTQNFAALPQLIGLTNVAELQQLVITGHRVCVGAAVSYQQIELALKDVCPEFAGLLHRLGSRQIRNQATLVGNIANASPIGDTPPILLTLNAQLTLASNTGQRTVALVDFFIDYKKTLLKPSEYIRQVEFDLPGERELFRVHKISKRFEDDISAVLMAVRWQVTDGKFSEVQIALGGMAAIPKRAREVEQRMIGLAACEQTVVTASKALAQEFTPLSDVRASSHYRLQVAQNLLIKTWLEGQSGRAGLSVWHPSGERLSQQVYGGDDA